MRRISRPHRIAALAAVSLTATTVAFVPTGASASPSAAGCANRQLNQIDKFLACVDGAAATEHLEALQSIADANGGTRASGTPGYDASADYVAALLEDAGYSVERQVFDFSLFTANSSSLNVDGVAIEHSPAEYSGSGSVTDGNIVPVDVQLGLGNTSTSGCEEADFDGLDFSGPNDIALIQRGACDFSVKVINAQDAGAEAVLIFNQGNTDAEDRNGVVFATLGEGAVGVVTIPALGISYADGVALLEGDPDVDLAADTTIETKSTQNVIAELEGENTDNWVMAGAHLDSVPEGPGINDNGSGSAALLTVALAIGNNRKYTPQNSLRFAWWGAEEAGLVGSTKYIFDPEFGISQEDYESLSSYLNFDMVGSPNFIYGVYDADESTFEASAPVPAGSAALEDLFEAYYSIEGVPYEDSEFSGRSDYQAFINVGIPSSGLFTGAEGIKTPEQEAIWGGTAGEQYDPCYHIACDTIDNVSAEALDVNVDAIAYAIYNLAATTEAVNGVAGVEPKGTTPDEVEFDGPQGTFLEGGGLSLHGEHAVS